MDKTSFVQEALRQGYTQEQINNYIQGVDGQQQQQVQAAPIQSAQIVPDASSAAPTQSDDPWINFLQTAKQVAKEQDFPLSVLAAQAALESARGQAAPGNNYFGIKGQGDNGSSNLPTQEADANGNYYTETSPFRAYTTPKASIEDYINLIKSQYPDAYAKRSDPLQMLQAIKAGGYATSPTYVQNVSAMPEFQAFQDQ